MQLPSTHYARSGDIAIAYQVHGSCEHDITGATASNIETMWALPEAVHLLERLGAFARVIRFDRRDTGLSDPIRDDLTLEANAADALAVMDAVGAERPVLVGGLDGARSLATLAATHPERAGRLIALWPTARGGAVEAPDLADEVARSVADLSWPGPLVDSWAPEWATDPVKRDQFNRYVRTTCTPRQAKRLLRLSLTSDTSEVLPLVQAPTLVLSTEGARLPQGAVREFADLIPNAVYRELPGDVTGFVFAVGPDLLADVIEEFVTGTRPAPVSSRVLATVLFTDLVSSTERAARLGDRAWTALLDRHHAAAHAVIAEHGGEMIKTLGDGVLATFTGPAPGGAVRRAHSRRRQGAGARRAQRCSHRRDRAGRRRRGRLGGPPRRSDPRSGWTRRGARIANRA